MDRSTKGRLLLEGRKNVTSGDYQKYYEKQYSNR